MRPALFISDLHLSEDRPDINRIFFRFLDGRARDASTLFILGDLFDYWAGDDDCDAPFNAAIIDAIAGLAEYGVQVRFIPGNRDFLAGDEFARRAKLTILPDPTKLDLFGTPTLLTHGDTLCTDDHEYMMFREQIRSDSWARDFLSKPLASRKAIIGGLRRQSEDEKRSKAADIMDVNTDAVDNLLRVQGYPRLIHGHTHRAARHEHIVDGHTCERWVLPDWYQQGSALVCDAHGCRQERL
jgi:UDP-2,3-diacylglucosamine hydrolase